MEYSAVSLDVAGGFLADLTLQREWAPWLMWKASVTGTIKETTTFVAIPLRAC